MNNENKFIKRGRFFLFMFRTVSKFNSVRSNLHGYDSLIPSTYWILIRKPFWFLDHWIAL